MSVRPKYQCDPNVESLAALSPLEIQEFCNEQPAIMEDDERWKMMFSARFEDLTQKFDFACAAMANTKVGKPDATVPTPWKNLYLDLLNVTTQEEYLCPLNKLLNEERLSPAEEWKFAEFGGYFPTLVGALAHNGCAYAKLTSVLHCGGLGVDIDKDVFLECLKERMEPADLVAHLIRNSGASVAVNLLGYFQPRGGALLWKITERDLFYERMIKDSDQRGLSALMSDKRLPEPPVYLAEVALRAWVEGETDRDIITFLADNAVGREEMLDLALKHEADDLYCYLSDHWDIKPGKKQIEAAVASSRIDVVERLVMSPGVRIGVLLGRKVILFVLRMGRDDLFWSLSAKYSLKPDKRHLKCAIEHGRTDVAEQLLGDASIEVMSEVLSLAVEGRQVGMLEKLIARSKPAAINKALKNHRWLSRDMEIATAFARSPLTDYSVLSLEKLRMFARACGVAVGKTWTRLAILNSLKASIPRDKASRDLSLGEICAAAHLDPVSATFADLIRVLTPHGALEITGDAGAVLGQLSRAASEGSGTPEVAAAAPLAKMTVRVLRQRARAHGIKASRMKKAELVAAIGKAENSADESA